MAIYKGMFEKIEKDDFDYYSDASDLGCGSNEKDLWSYVEPFSIQLEDIFNFVAPYVVFDKISNDNSARKKVLTFYHKYQKTIDKTIEKLSQIEDKRNNWFIQQTTATIYDTVEQQHIRSVLIYMTLVPEEEIGRVTELFAKIGGQAILVMGKKATNSVKSVRHTNKMLGEIGFSETVTLDTLAQHAKLEHIISKGLVRPFPFESTSLYNEELFEFFYFYYFYDTYITKFPYMHIAICDKDYLTEFILATVNRYQQYIVGDMGLDINTLIKKELLGIEEVTEQLPVKHEQSNSDKQFHFTDIDLTISKRDSIRTFLTNNANILQNKVDETMENYIRKNKALQKGHVESLIGHGQNTYLEDRASHFIEDETINNQLVAVQIINESIARNVYEKMAEYPQVVELINKPLTKELWGTLQSAMHLIDVFVPLREIDLDFENRFALELNMFIDKALYYLVSEYSYNTIGNLNTVLLEELDKRQQQEEVVEVNSRKLDKQSAFIRELQFLKKQVKNADERILKLSKDAARVEALELKLQETLKVNKELQNKLETIEPVIIERVVTSTEPVATKEEVIQRLNRKETTFVGGHQSWQTKIKQWAPHATFIAPRDYTVTISEKADFVVLNTAYINHSMYYKVKARIKQIEQTTGKTLKLIYLNTQATSREHIVEDIRQQLSVV